jgi:hypothetical protein
MDAVGAKNLAEEFLEKVVFLIGAFGRRKPGHGGGAEASPKIDEALSHRGKGLLPRGGAELSLAADKWCGEPFVAVNEIEAVPPLDAEHTVADRVAFNAGNSDNSTSLAIDMEDETAPDTAVGADCSGGVKARVLSRKGEGFVEESAGGTDLDALSALDAGGLAHGQLLVADDARFRGTSGYAQHVVHDNIAAGLDTAAAHYAFAGIKDDEGRGIVGRRKRTGTRIGCSL